MKRSYTFVLLFLALFVAMPAVAQDARYGNFSFSSDKDAFTDKNRSYIISNTEDLALGAKCFHDGLNVIIAVGYQAGDDDDDVQVMYRFDTEDPVGPFYAPLSQSNKLIYLPMRRVPNFTRKMRSSEKVAVRVIDPYDGEITQEVVSLDGATAGLSAIGECQPE